ncbi:hypothetical protein BD410DRAFT_788108 [Rickenella mellea]|uniref:Membrane-associated proteins in eicosanoid and glutathione metabolism n=1 Tax=Rickenella mellea TaxID=50990 RepID=A0A4Y7Q5D1_9AGAM|nr:hypothetical protein BD410DRAFT_788108 [Rickenella mellea]
MPFTWSTPLSLYSIPAVWLTSFVPMNLKFSLIARTIGYNNVQPRANTGRMVNNRAVPKDVAAQAERMEGAHLNGNEMLPIWIAAVLAGNQAGVAQETLNSVSVAFIVTRILYNYVYITHTTQLASTLRTGLWSISLSLPMYLIVKAGNILRTRGSL